MVELKELDQQQLSAYVRWTGYCGLHLPFDFSYVEGLDCVYSYEEKYKSHLFSFSNGATVFDWTLSPSDMDKALKMARRTEKKLKQEERKKKYV